MRSKLVLSAACVAAAASAGCGGTPRVEVGAFSCGRPDGRDVVLLQAFAVNEGDGDSDVEARFAVVTATGERATEREDAYVGRRRTVDGRGQISLEGTIRLPRAGSEPVRCEVRLTGDGTDGAKRTARPRPASDG